MNNDIIIISNTDGAMYKFRKSLVKKLHQSGYKTTCIVSPTSPEGSYIERLQSICSNVIPVNFFRQTKLSIFTTPFKILSEILKINPKIIHIYGHEALIYSILLVFFKKKSKKFITITGLGKFFSNERTSLQNFIRILIIQLYNLALPFISKVIFLNKHDHNLFNKLFPTYSNKFTIINGEGSDFSISYQLNAKQDGNYRFLYASRIMAQKGIIELIDAFISLPKNYKLTVLGTIDKSIESHPSVLNAINGNFDNINFLGFQDDISSYLIESDCIVLPSKYPEGLPIILVEALAKGKFILTSYAPGCADTVEEGENGFLLDTVSIESIKYNVQKINTVDFQKAHETSTKLFNEKFSAHIVVNKIIDIYALE